MEDYSWLCYSQDLDGAFCLPCVLFGAQFRSHQTMQLVDKPLCVWRKAKDLFSLHEFGEDNAYLPLFYFKS